MTVSSTSCVAPAPSSSNACCAAPPGSPLAAISTLPRWLLQKKTCVPANFLPQLSCWRWTPPPFNFLPTPSTLSVPICPGASSWDHISTTPLSTPECWPRPLASPPPRAHLVLLTHEITLFENVLQDCTEWTLKDVVKLFQGGLHPRIYLFQRAASH